MGIDAGREAVATVLVYLMNRTSFPSRPMTIHHIEHRYRYILGSMDRLGRYLYRLDNNW